jgi:hypothetical protein
MAAQMVDFSHHLQMVSYVGVNGEMIVTGINTDKQ